MPIPKDGEVKEVNKVIKLKDGSVIITSVERTSHPSFNNGALKINLKYNNTYDNKKLISIDLTQIDIKGSELGGGYSIETDENQITTAIYFALEKEDSGSLRLKVADALYVFTDEYTLTLGDK